MMNNPTIDLALTGANIVRLRKSAGLSVETYKLSLGSIPRRRFTSGRVELRSRLSII